MNTETTYPDSIPLKPWVQSLLILVICVFSFFTHIASDELEIMEARNFVSAREMVADGSWILPTMNGEPRFEKPPLPTWITAVAVMMGGSPGNMLAMRIPAAVTATLMVFFAFGFFRAIFEKNSILPFIIATLFAVNAFVIVLGRRNSWDIYAHCFMMAVVWALWVGWEEKNNSNIPFVIAGIAAGLSFLSKGPVDFYSLLLPFFIAYVTAFGIKPVWQKKSKLLLFIFSAVVVASTWPLYVYINKPNAGLAAAQQEVRDWGIDRVRPFYYYLSFPLFSGAWIIFFLAYFIKPFAKPRIRSIFNYSFPLVWLLATVVFLSVVPQKKERYLMPAAIPMSMMIGFMIYALCQRYQSFQQTYGDRLLVKLHTGLVVTMSLAIPAVYYSLNKDISISVMVWPALLLIFGITAWRVYRAGKKSRIFSLFILTQIFMCLSITALWHGLSMEDHENKEFKSIREFRLAHDVSGLDFYSTSPIKILAIWDIGQKVLPWTFDKTTVPRDRKCVLFFQSREEALQFAADYGSKINLNILDEYKWSPTNPDKIIVAALVES